MSQCSVADCGRAILARGFCGLHYKRFMAHGSTTLSRRAAGEGAFSTQGYIRHGKAKKGEHVIVAERALGKSLPTGAEVHHINEDKADNRPANLVICPSRAYHFLLHQRQRALDACGHADWRKCPYCKRHDDTANMSESSGGKTTYYFHRPCAAAWANNKRKGIA